MAEKPTSTSASLSPWSRKRKLLIGGLFIAVVVVALALGLGLGLTVGKDDSDEASSESPSPSSRSLWLPKPSDSWQIVLLNDIALDTSASSITPDVDIFDIDLFNTPVSTIDSLHRLGKKVICYFSAGSSEEWRPDYGDFDEEDMGHGLEGWAGERWLKLSSKNVRKIMRKRVEMAARKGCDGLDPDNLDGYQNNNGLGLGTSDSISFIRYLSSLSAPRNLTLGLKNSGDIIPDVLNLVHFSVNEQCVEEAECETFRAFIEDGKPVFHIEYPEQAGEKLGREELEYYCGDDGDAKGRDGFSTVLKTMELDGWVEFCDQNVEVTAMNEMDDEE